MLSECNLCISIFKIVDDPLTLPRKTNIRPSLLFAYGQAETLFSVDPNLLSLAEMNVSVEVETEINELIQKTIANQRSEKQRGEKLENVAGVVFKNESLEESIKTSYTFSLVTI